MAFSNNLRYLRKKNGWSQELLAERLGYKSFTTIQKWESGVSEPSVSIVKTIASIFNVSMDELVNHDLESNQEAKSSSDKTYYLNPEAAEMAQELYERPEMRVLFDASRKATKEDIEQVADILKKLSGK